MDDPFKMRYKKNTFMDDPRIKAKLGSPQGNFMNIPKKLFLLPDKIWQRKAVFYELAALHRAIWQHC